MGINPFMYFSYQGELIKPIDEVICKETAGDCLKWINKYLNITYQEYYSRSTTTATWKNYKATICSAEHTEDFNKGALQLCGPTDMLSI